MERWGVTVTSLCATRRSTFRLNVKSAICSFVGCTAQITTIIAVTVKFKLLMTRIIHKGRKQKVRAKLLKIVNFKGNRKMKNNVNRKQ